MGATEPPNYFPPSATPTPTPEGGNESYAEFDPAKIDEDDVLSFEDGDESVVEHSLYEPIYVEDSDDDDIDGSTEQSWNCTGGKRNLTWVQEMTVAFGAQEEEKKKKKRRKKEKKIEKEKEREKKEDPLDDGREEDRAFWAACLASGYP